MCEKIKHVFHHISISITWNFTFWLIYGYGGEKELLGLNHYSDDKVFLRFRQIQFEKNHLTFSKRSVSLVDRAAGCCVHCSNILYQSPSPLLQIIIS